VRRKTGLREEKTRIRHLGGEKQRIKQGLPGGVHHGRISTIGNQRAAQQRPGPEEHGKGARVGCWNRNKKRRKGFSEGDRSR